ncbi:NAD(P)-dependent alcohol dehydrogenase [Pelagibacterium luteolum]|uniref:NADPH:quinone reductase n=1 Tax=Pelagibacterium luteolum TaxID=440168 RepID=A0A1G7W403_9HYPH|nr:NAD(P)-dependent alcohol dehydrogenase [Pelagibacterium luteolum]SDG65890.1 NADPH:quinone reductase [Pelagibacterium luteolum]
MQAWFARRYGGVDVLRLEELATPTPRAGQLLIRVHATTVNSADVRVRACNFPRGTKTIGRLVLGWNGPRQPMLGTELAGVVEAVGPGVNRFRSGDKVFAFPGGKMGSHAQFVVMSENGPVAHIPEGLDFASAASLSFGGTTALHFLRAARLRPDDSLLVLGGSGAVGLAMVQLGRHQGAKVTATTSTLNCELVADHGANSVIDYTTPPVSGRYDIIADTVGAMNFTTAQDVLKPHGRYLAIAGGLAEMVGALRPGPHNTKMIAGPATESLQDITELARLFGAGHFRSHIDHVYSWPDLPAAHAHADTGRKRGSVVVTLRE